MSTLRARLDPLVGAAGDGARAGRPWLKRDHWTSENLTGLGEAARRRPLRTLLVGAVLVGLLVVLPSALVRQDHSLAAAEVQGSVGESLADVINPLDRKNFRGGRPMEDETFRTEFEAILDDDQKASLAAKSEADEAASEGAADGPADTSITSLPTMGLETLDEAVGSAKKMTSGFRSMMEGMGTLRQLQPQIDGDSGDQGEGE